MTNDQCADAHTRRLRRVYCRRVIFLRSLTRRDFRVDEDERAWPATTSGWTWTAVVARQDTNRPHHAAVLMLEQVAVIDERPHRVRVPEIHPQTHARVVKHPVGVIRNVDRVAQERLIDGCPGPVHEH